jgi:hypothetical protein
MGSLCYVNEYSCIQVVQPVIISAEQMSPLALPTLININISIF